jgi:hypothetical protein
MGKAEAPPAVAAAPSATKGPAKPAVGLDPVEEEKKRKRAERFGAGPPVSPTFFVIERIPSPL